LIAEPVTRLAELAGRGEDSQWWQRLRLDHWPRAVVTISGRVSSTTRPAGKLALLWKKPHFIGRSSEKDRLVAGLTEGLESSSPVAMISGMGGVGKTELANQVAHELGDYFPTARILVPLGAPEDPVDGGVVRILRGFGLHGFGPGDERIPPSAEARRSRLEELLGAGGCLLVLDNATSAAQVRPLLPATYGNAIIVTSREPLSGLDATVKVSLRPLPEDVGVSLLRRIRTDRFDDEAARRIVALTAGLPLAIRIAGEVLTHLSVAELAEYLVGEPNLESIMNDPERSVHAVFDSSYQNLPAEWARCFRVLGVLDVPEFGHEWIAHAAGVDSPAGQRLARRLGRPAARGTGAGTCGPRAAHRIPSRRVRRTTRSAVSASPTGPTRCGSRNASRTSSSTSSSSARSPAAPRRAWSRASPARSGSGE
jgi:NB-ARC domain